MKTTPPGKINNGSGKLYLLRQERVFAKKEWLTSWTEQPGAEEAIESATACWESN